jgi:hypothetical protein
MLYVRCLKGHPQRPSVSVLITHLNESEVQGSSGELLDESRGTQTWDATQSH